MADPVLANVRGAGLLTFLALGQVKVEDIAAMVDIRATFEPDPSQAKVYDRLYPGIRQSLQEHQADPQASEPPLNGRH